MGIAASRLRVSLAAILLTGIVASAAGVTYAAFTAATSNPTSSFQSMDVFPRSRTTSAWDIRDRTSGAEVNQSGAFAYTNDARTDTTKSWPTTNAYNTANYLEFDYNNPLPGGRPVSSVELKFRYAASTGRTACFYYDVRKVSDNSVLATYGGTGNDQGCVTGATQTLHTESIPIVTTTDQANDLRIRVYVRQSGTAAAITVDRAVVTGSYTYSNFVLYRTRDDDRANGVAAVTLWGPHASDASAYATSTVTTSFNTSEWVEFKFPTTVPAAASLTSVSVDISYRSTSGTACFYYEVLNGSTVLQTVGSTGTPADCNATTSFEVVAPQTLSSVNTPAKANNLTLKIYLRNSGSQAVQFDLIRLNTTWSVNAGGASGTSCTDPGSSTVVTARDGFTDQNAPTSTSGGTDAKLIVSTKATNLNMRSFVHFALPTVPSGCTASEATLSLYQIAANGTRTIQAYQAAATPAWTEANLTWNNSPAITGTPATTTNAINTLRTWDVTGIVQAMYSGTNNGFVLKDQTENSATEYKQEFAAREDSSFADPQLVVTWN